MSDPHLATPRVWRLIQLTEQLTARLETETAAFQAHRPQDVIAGMAETQELANAYRRESAQLKAAPSVLHAAAAGERQALVRATQTFEAVLAVHGRAVEAARVISEGLVKAIAAEVAAARTPPAGYAAGGRAIAGDGRAVALNRSA